MEARVGIEPTMAELQSTALPLCYRALTIKRSLMLISEDAILGIISKKSTTSRSQHAIAAALDEYSRPSTTVSAQPPRKLPQNRAD